jgi:hypothetical protein
MQVSSIFLRFLSAGLTVGSILFLASTPMAAEEPAPGDASTYIVSPALKHTLEQHRYFKAADPAANELLARRRWRRTWVASWAAFAAVNLIDIHSSAGKGELNPLLRTADGRFSTRKAGLFKAGLGGGFLAFQGWMIKKNPDRNLYKPFTFANIGATGAMGAVAAHNYNLD